MLGLVGISHLVRTIFSLMGSCGLREPSTAEVAGKRACCGTGQLLGLGGEPLPAHMMYYSTHLLVKALQSNEIQFVT